ncbi:acyl-CoA desaturase [Rhodococcus sp. 14-2470-1b]|uniref:fatty acid desaturase family protein n=1 Tax=Rhodococcus sp. 14-2470-1b TaxID=2023149 RepID=UPI0011401502|nr:acyl-CoA desaturase [Rhodococcus sp. 14-2470-1b]
MVKSFQDLNSPLSGTYEELTRLVDDFGLLSTRPRYFAFKIVFNMLTLAACYLAILLLGNSWWSILIAVVLALAFVQSGFIAHDTGHKQISRAKTSSQILGMFHMNFLTGISYGWWVNHHNRHHSNPNNLDKDPDTIRRPVIFDADEYPRKATTAYRKFIVRFQHYMFFVLLSHEAYRIRAAGFQAVRLGLIKRPWLEVSLVLLHFATYLSVIFIALPPSKALIFILVHQVLFGFYLGAVFAPNHKGMPVYRDELSLNWLHRQVLTSRNISSNYFVDFLYGGLNYQIEHHLFPSMARANLRRVRPVVMQYCRDNGIPYREVSIWESYAAVARFLRIVSRDARSPRAV